MTKNQEEIDRRNEEIAVNQEIANNENEQREALPLREQVLEIFKNYGFTLLATGVTIGARDWCIIQPSEKGRQGHWQRATDNEHKNRAHRRDCKLHFQGRRHLAHNSCRDLLSDGTVPQAQSLTLTNKQTSQKNCSHNDQRLVYVMTRERWSWVRWRGDGWSGRRL